MTCVSVCALSHFSRFRFCVTPWAVADQAPPFMGFSRQEYWVAISFSRDLPDPGNEPVSPEAPAWQVHSVLLSHSGNP